MGGATPPIGVKARYMALYSIAPGEQIDQRLDALTANRPKMPDAERETLRVIIEIITEYLHRHNRYVKLLLTRAEREEAGINQDPQPTWNVSRSLYGKVVTLSGCILQFAGPADAEDGTFAEPK